LTTPANSQQQNELSQLYASYSEAELNDLALTAEDLTDSAQQALQAEYNRRGLVQPKLLTPQGVAAQGDGDPLQTFSSNAPTECVFEFTDLEDAILAQSVLKSAGIPSIVPTSEIGAIDTPRLIVGPSDAQAAELLLSRPNALGRVSPEDALFPEAVCPKCGTPDPLLESVEPTNQWLCEACNHTWEDTELV
jgi:hypothetical protein